jgi:hypothetical protein
MRCDLISSFLIPIVLTCTSVCLAQEAKSDKLPRIIVAAPLAIAPGMPVKLALRGLFLEDVIEVKIGDTELKAEIASKGKTAVPQNYDPKRIGDTQAEIKFALPADAPHGPLQLVAVTAGGVSVPYEITVASAADLIEEKEPNDGFKTAQSITPGKSVVGTIHEPRNVDVFAIQGQPGQKFVIEVLASHAGSPLDPFLTLYDARGQIVIGNDDSNGRDPRLEVELSNSDSYFLSIQDANDAGGPHFTYLLKITRR